MSLQLCATFMNLNVMKENKNPELCKLPTTVDGQRRQSVARHSTTSGMGFFRTPTEINLFANLLNDKYELVKHQPSIRDPGRLKIESQCTGGHFRMPDERRRDEQRFSGNSLQNSKFSTGFRRKTAKFQRMSVKALTLKR